LTTELGEATVKSPAPRARSAWPSWGQFAAAVGFGLLLGTVARLGDQTGKDLAWVFNLGGPWFIIAFIYGARVRRVLAGAIGAALLMAVAVATYYLLAPSFDVPREAAAAVPLTVIWTFVGGVGGAAMGAGGALWQAATGARRAVGVALLAGVLAGEGLVQYLRLGRGGDFVFGIELALGLMLPFALLSDGREREWSLAVTAAMTVFAFFAVFVIRLFTKSLV